MLPERLPSSEEDLGAWRVYADALLAAGDPLGPLLALDLNLPPAPNALELQQFHHAAQRRCRASKFLDVGWCLGHARTLAVHAAERQPMTKRMMPPSVLPEQLVELGAFLTKPQARLVESVDVQLTPDLARELIKALQHTPPSCKTLALELHGDWTREADRLVHELPPVFTRIRVVAGDPGPFLKGRFDEVDLRSLHYPFFHVPPVSHPAPRIVAGSIGLAKQRGVELGRPGDAALLDVKAQALTLLMPRPLTELQKRHGVVSVRAQLDRTVPELHPGVPQLMRYAGGSWKVRVDHEYFQATVDGVEVGVGHSAPVVTGSQVVCQGQERIFLEDAALWPTYCP